MRFIKTLALFMAGLLSCLFLASCGEDYMDAYIYVDLSGTASVLDPQLADSTEELTVVRSVFDTLLRYDENGKIVPSAATKYSKNGMVYTFSLREDAVWNDGTAVTAADFVFGFTRAVSPETNAPFAGTLFAIKGAKEINQAGADPSTLGVRATGKYTLEITLCEDDPEFEKVLTSAITAPCNETFFSSCKGKYGLTIDTTPSNGSYYVKEWTSETKFLIRLAKNLDYTGPFEARSMRIYFTCGDTDALTMLERDNTDLAYISTEEYESIAGSFETVTVEDTCYVLLVNDSINEDIRKALLTSISADSLQNILGGTQRPAETLYPAVLGVSDAPKVTDSIFYDADAASETYAKAVRDGLVPENITLQYPGNAVSEAAAKSIAGHWQQTLSCFINIEGSSTQALTSAYRSGYYDIMILPFPATVNTVRAYNSTLGFDGCSISEVCEEMFGGYTGYPLYFSTSNISCGSKIQNLSDTIGGGILDVSLLIKKQN